MRNTHNLQLFIFLFRFHLISRVWYDVIIDDQIWFLPPRRWLEQVHILSEIARKSQSHVFHNTLEGKNLKLLHFWKFSVFQCLKSFKSTKADVWSILFKLVADSMMSVLGILSSLTGTLHFNTLLTALPILAIRKPNVTSAKRLCGS